MKNETRFGVVWFALLMFCASFLQASAREIISDREERIVIFHFNDIHGKIDNFARVATLVERERQKGDQVYLFSAGDNFTGNPIVDQFDPPGKPMLDLLNRLRVDLLTIGNHEFDYGLDRLERFAAEADFPLLSANIDRGKKCLPRLKSSAVLNTPQGHRLAVFGLIQIEAGNGIPSTHPDKVKGLKFREPLDRARALKRLRRKNHVLLALTHIGYEQDLLLATQMPELDIIIGGHSHTRIDPAETVNGVLIAQAGSDNRFLGRIDLLLQNGRLVEKKGCLIDLKSVDDIDPEIQNMIEGYNNNPLFRQVLATATQEIVGKEALGALMTDAICRVHGLDIAFQNNGGIRMGRLPKEITLKDIYTLDPFGNQVVVMNMSTEEIRSLISGSLGRDGKIDLQVSGMEYIVLADDKGHVGEIRIVDQKGRPFDEKRIHRVGLSSYVASSYRFKHGDVGRALGVTTAETLIRFLKSGADLSRYQDLRRAHREGFKDET